MLAEAYAKVREKVLGESPSPWWTRWFWWLVISSMFLLVFGIWWLSKNREARVKAIAKTAEEKAIRAELEVRAEHDVKKAAELREKARIARREADRVASELKKSAEDRKKLEAAIKGAKTWEELEELEEGIE